MRVLEQKAARTRFPLFLWAHDPEKRTLTQAVAIRRLPFVRHAAFMADMHAGYGFPIGSVVACESAVIP
jgi:tRNA-splicing ligase RtcB (3'-phosphate/5'-hydroxy nucleic acid ligase)